MIMKNRFYGWFLLGIFFTGSLFSLTFSCHFTLSSSLLKHIELFLATGLLLLIPVLELPSGRLPGKL
ncbi:hypothetical protein EDB19DRAFT_1700934 [Suillus lakei]|nr:hypothetical protein EDB19DRAFT_1700934 [Suillus lakei]